jgi:hypothetical protein
MSGLVVVPTIALYFIRRLPRSERGTESPYSGCNDIDPTRSSAHDPLGLQALLPKRSLLVGYRSTLTVTRRELPRSLVGNPFLRVLP